MKTKSIFQTAVLMLFFNALLAQNTYVFVGTFNRSKDKEGIAVYKLADDGLLTKVDSIKGILNPSYLDIANDSIYLYACTETQTKNSGYITGFKFEPLNGKLTMLNRQKTSGENPVFLSVDKSDKTLICVNYTEASLDVFPLLTDGNIGNKIQTIKYKQGSSATSRQKIAHPHAVVFSPDYKYILVPDLGSDDIKCYNFDTAEKQPVSLSTLGKTKSSPATGPRHIRFHPNGQYAYCVGEIAGTVAAYNFNEEKLTLIDIEALHNGNDGDYNSADVRISPDGKFLYASNRGEENNLAIFSIALDGKLTFIAYQSTLGEHPRMFDISEDGQFLIVANQISGNLVVFRRNLETGLLLPTQQEIIIENPSCVQIKKYN